MPWDVALVMTSAGDGSPLTGIPVIEAGPQGTRLTTTDESGAAAVTLDVNTSLPSVLSALYVLASDLEFTISSWSRGVTVLGSSPIIPSPPTIRFLE